MKTFVRFDAVGGASGDMVLAALIGLGADQETIARQLNAFLPEPISLHLRPEIRSGLAGLHLDVALTNQPAHADPTHAHHHGHAGHHHSHQSHAETPAVWQETGHAAADHHHHHRAWTEIRRLIETSSLPQRARTLSIAAFARLAEAEAKIHGKTVDTVHFHEVGAWDSIADTVGACLALDQLGVDGVAVGPLPCGIGTIACAHGAMPNPAPATQELLAGMTIIQTDEPFELVTPTGAALLSTWSRDLEPPPAKLRVVRSALAFGTRTLHSRPNLLRATLLHTVEETPADDDTLQILETNLDDCNPEWIGALFDTLLRQGALDVWTTPATMKKNRPATLLSVLCREADKPALMRLIFTQTTTFGIRHYPVSRTALARRIDQVQTAYGTVPVKIGLLDGDVVTRSPEYDACAALAALAGIAPRAIYTAALTATPHR